MNDPIASALESRRHEGRPCVRPGCAAVARCAFYVAGPARLAGRWWNPGDFIDLCPADAVDVHRFHPGDPDSIAGWMADDIALMRCRLARCPGCWTCWGEWHLGRDEFDDSTAADTPTTMGG